MTIGFYHVDRQTEASDLAHACARLMVKSAKRTMPFVQVVQFTDLTSKAVKGVDDVRRKPAEPMALLRMRHHAGVQGEWLFVDTDVIFQQSVLRVWKSDFDIALTTRNWHHLRVAAGFTDRMPFNTGVVFSRSPRFWADAYTRLRVLDDERTAWMGDQEVICEMEAENQESRRYAIAYRHGSIYNFPPAVDPDDNHALSAKMQADARIIHYKGPSRKPLLLKLHKVVKQCA